MSRDLYQNHIKKMKLGAQKPGSYFKKELLS